MFYRQSRDTFIRSIGEYSYIYSQLTKHDRTYTQEGRAFLEVLSRDPQSLDALAAKASEYFEGVAPANIKEDLREVLDSLVADRYLVSGNTAEECAAKDTYFSYAENPKTLFTYNAQQNPDDDKLYSDTQEVLGVHYREHPQIHSCQIETTNRCNERCIHCYIPHELKNVVLPYEVIESVLQQLHDLGVLGLTLSGGEFFTHPDAEKILRKARELDFSFYVLSNIALLTSRMIDVLKEVNPSYVQTSLYSVNPEEHDHITQLKGSCEKTKAAIEALIAANIPVQISCPVMKT
ncbi:radical SAM protein, partial [uncultured Fibrobacter sp.]|uniref:radical SAM protein n=1 Tax=uncultured Fibrobacter sp. TaxID=261512 RepID=UPI0025D6AC8E